MRPGYLTTAAAASLPVAERYAAAATQAAPPLSAAADSCSSPCGARASRLSSGPSRPGGVAAAYTGRQAAACFRDPPAAWAQPALGLATKGSTGERHSKDAVYLRTLDQHSRGRLPGYTGHRPQHNVALDLPPPSSLTTWGAASQEALCRRADAHGSQGAWGWLKAGSCVVVVMVVAMGGWGWGDGEWGARCVGYDEPAKLPSPAVSLLPTPASLAAHATASIHAHRPAWLPTQAAAANQHRLARDQERLPGVLFGRQLCGSPGFCE